MFSKRLKKPTRRLVPKRPTRRYRYVRLRWHLFFALFDLVGGAIFGIVGLIVKPVARFLGKTRNQTQPPRSILVLQLDHLGDAILSTGMLHVLRKNYPSARIDLLVGPWNRSLFEAAVDDVDRVLVFDGGGRLARLGVLRGVTWMASLFWPCDLFRYAWSLRRERYDLGIDVRGEMPHALLLWIAGVRRRVGWASGGGGFLLTDSPAWLPDRPEIESRRAILETLGLHATPQDLLPRIRVPRLAGSPATGLTYDFRTGSRYIVIHLAAGTQAKEWPVGHWGRLISNLIEEPDETPTMPSTKIVLVGTESDHIIGQKVEALVVGDKTRLVNRIGQLSLVELAAVLRQAELMIGADSGPAHLAAAVGTPTVVLFSGTNRSEQWRPPGEHVTVIDHPVPCHPCHQKRACPVEGHPCMAGITPDRVAEVVKKRTEDRKKRTEDKEQRTEGATAPGKNGAGKEDF